MIYNIMIFFRLGKLYTAILLCMVSIFFSQNALAFSCTSASGQTIPVGGGGATITVSVDPAMSAGKYQVVDLYSGANAITCTTEYGVTNTDTLKTAPTNAVLSLPGLQSLSGATISGVDYALDSANNIQLMSITGKKRGTNSAKIPMQLYYNVIESPSKSVIIKQGEIIYTLNLRQTNNLGDDELYTWLFMAGNDSYVITSTCTINNGEQVNVSFGDIHAEDLSADAASSKHIVKKDLTYHCNNPVTQDIDIMLIAAPVVGFSETGVITTSNTNIGVAMLFNSEVVPAGDVYHTQLVDGAGTDEVSFVPVKKDNSVDLSTLQGSFTASATLVMTTA